MAEGFHHEHYHVPQQSRRDKLRVVLEPSPTLHPLPSSLYDPSLLSSDLLACVNNNNHHQQDHHVLFHGGKANHGGGGGGSVKEERSNFMMGFVNSTGGGGSSSSSSSPAAASSASVSHHNPYLDPFLYPSHQNLQNFREFYYNDGSSGIMVFKPEPLSLSLSSHNKNSTHHHALELNLDRYGAIYGDKVGCSGGGGGVVPVVVGGGGSDVCVSNENSTVVPVGPFTGYSSVLKGSRFLRPAQQLLEELCDIGVRGVYSEKIIADESLMETPVESLSASGIVVDDSSLGDVNNEGRKNKSRLLTMLDEVYRRYRLYYQQMHAVVTSFEYVAGLGNAAPYASLAVNAMSKHFRCLKNAITDQLQFINKAHFQMSNRKDESPRFRGSDRGGPYGQRSTGFLEHQQPVWRPQRGLPERAVSVLRAWLFEHFLHPYPTDTDKLMLSKQTGLSRSQVSNWFINARVRLWKPMVEEIHMLESQQSQKISQREEHSRNNLSDHHLPSDNITENPSTSTHKFRTRDELPNMPVRSQEQLNQQTNTRNLQQVGVGGSMGSTGAGNNGVSLTLGLHQNHGIGLSEPFRMSQHFGLALQPEAVYVTSGFESHNRHFGRDVIGGQLLHDFVG